MNELFRKILWLPEQASTVARELDTLHFVVISTTMVGATFVTAMALYFLVRYRASRRADASPAPRESPFHNESGTSVWFELFLFGGLLVLFTVLWIFGFRQFVRFQVPPEDSLEVYVSAKQWMWKFAYSNGATSETTLYVPEDRPVKLILSSRDVIHSFYVPAFRIKQDVLPGRVNIAWFEANRPGRYSILCTEYCGLSHSTMRGTVEVLAPADYAAWLRQSGAAVLGDYVRSPDGVRSDPGDLSLASVGERAAARLGCLRCHTVDGTPHLGPTWARLYRSLVPLQGGGTQIADEAYITRSMMDPLDQIHAGFEPVMPSYQGRITAAETGAIVEYIKSLRDIPLSDAAEPLPRIPGIPEAMQDQVPGTIPGQSAQEAPAARPEQAPGMPVDTPGGTPESSRKPPGVTGEQADTEQQ